MVQVPLCSSTDITLIVAMIVVEEEVLLIHCCLSFFWDDVVSTLTLLIAGRGVLTVNPEQRRACFIMPFRKEVVCRLNQRTQTGLQ
jgi:hypothetical protein